MARADQILENPVTGERIIFRKSARESDGHDWEAELFYQPHTGRLPLAHYHPRLEESFEVLAGTASYVIEGEERTSAAGEKFIFRPGTPHINPWNDGEQELHLRQKLHLDEPDLQSLAAIEEFVETLYGLARDGKVDARGRPNPLQLMVVLHALQRVGYLAGIPVPIQRVFFGSMAGIGRLVGYRARYPEYSEA